MEHGDKRPMFNRLTTRKGPNNFTGSQLATDIFFLPCCVFFRKLLIKKMHTCIWLKYSPANVTVRICVMLLDADLNLHDRVLFGIP